MPTRRARCVSGFWTRQVPGHALHEEGLQRQIGVGTLVNSQQRRALAVPVLNRGQTAGQPVVNRLFGSSTGLHRISFVHAWRTRGAVGFQGDRNVGTLFCPASPHPAVRPAPCRPDRCVSGFWTRQVPRNALHEKGLQRQIGVGTLVNSQQRRALAVPVMNR